MRRSILFIAPVFALAVVLSAAQIARADDLLDSGKLLATGGLSQVEGAAGGGLASWAVITGYETRDGIGGNAHYTFLDLPNFTLHSLGGAVGLYDRVELSYAHEFFETGATGARLGLGNGFVFANDVVGAKLRVYGSAVYDQDVPWPQIAIGLQFKHSGQPAVLKAVGAKDPDGVDFYLAATKLILRESILLDATLRATRANDLGILGFGGGRNNDYQPEFEGSAALLLSRKIAVGGEFRTRPDNLVFTREDNAFDLFGSYFIDKNLSLILAYGNLGTIATFKDQDGLYLSIQAGI